MSRFTILAAIALFGCKGKDDGNDTGFRVDNDADGFYANEDCDDNNAIINPDADELCDGIDNDCDGAIDGDDKDLDDGEFYYTDLDADGFGDDTTGVRSCDLIKDAVTLGGDCDDADADINPNAQEICDTKDNDCDLLTDDEDTDTYGQLEYKIDVDGDGWGDEKAAPERFCFDPGKGYVPYDAATPQDCDDSNVDYHPYAPEECTDKEDYNCDGSTGYDDFDKDGSPACEDCDDANPAVFPGNPEICDLFDNNCNTYIDDADPDLADESTYYYDYDADGYGDATLSEVTCAAEPNYVESSDDCDDGNKNIHPGATEICDRLDDDCDLAIPSDETDDDGDTYVECEPTADCNDADGAIHPGADELCSTAGVDDDCDGVSDESSAVDTTTWWYDFDSDGFGGSSLSTVSCLQPANYVATNTDCNDGASTAYPGATELCNGDDDDCNLVIPADETDADGDTYMVCAGDCDDTDPTAYPGSKLFYKDVDGDGYGLTASTTTDCTAPSGYADVGGDCLDSNAAVNPGAIEKCDSIDNNCVGGVDESTAVDAKTWYADSDSDDFGDAAVTTTACNEPASYTDNSLDCDDTDGTINPSATEVCNDGKDNNCDGDSGTCELDATDASDVVWAGEASLDQAGLAIASGGDVDSDGINELLIGAKGNSSAAASAGAAYLVWGPVTAGTTGLGSVDAQKMVGDAASNNLGRSVAFIDDMDSDGFDDIAVGAGNQSTTGKTNNGTVFLASGVDMGHVSATMSSLATYSLIGAKSYDYVGTGLQAGGDVDDDGSPDVWIGAVGVDDSAVAAGAVYLLLGDLVAGSGTAGTATAAKITGDVASDAIGSILGSGDFDGDGFSDLLIGDPLDADSGTSAGAVSIFAGPVSGTVSINAADAKLIASSAGDGLGAAVCSAGDTDGDGNDDLLVGAPNADTNGVSSGAAYLVLGSSTIGDLSGEADTIAEATFNGESSNHHAGGGLGASGDFDGDGEGDFLIGAYGYGAATEGAVYLVLGPRSGSMTLDLDAGDAATRLVGDDTNDQIGKQAVFTGQVSGSFTEGIYFSSGYDDLGGVDSGAAYIVFDVGL